MWTGFFFTTLTLLLPVLIGIFCFQRYRPLLSQFPSCMAMQFAFFALTTAATFDLFTFGWAKLMVCSFLGALLALEFIRYQGIAPTPSGPRNNISWAFPFALAILFNLDSAWILFKQGWHEGTAYFQPPFNHDVERNLAIIEALFRGKMDPHFPGNTLIYQYFWFHPAATLLYFFNLPSRYAPMCGLHLYLLILFFTCFYQVLRKKISHTPTWIALCLLTALHADLYNMAVSIFGYGSLGIEADISAARISIFRFTSLKWIGLTAPQHFLFPFFLLFYLEGGFAPLGRSVMLTLSFMASPILWMMSFPLLLLTQLKEGWKWIFPIGIGTLLYRIFYWQWPHQLFLIQSPEKQTELFQNLGWGWLALPFILGISFGPLGLWITPHLIQRKRPQNLSALLIIIVLLYTFVFTSPELKRHSNFISILLVCLTAAQLIPSRKILTGMIGITLLFHGYFLYAFVGKPSVVPNTIPWKDYLSMNHWMRTHHFKENTIGAVNGDFGILYPLAMQANTSFITADKVIFRSNLSPDIFKRLQRLKLEQNVVPHATVLGYSTITWGPLEEATWGAMTRRRFIDPSLLIHREGSVGLYTIFDKLRHAYPGEKLAPALADENWLLEAIDEYQKILIQNPQSPFAHQGLARLFDKNGMIQAAEYHRAQLK